MGAPGSSNSSSNTVSPRAATGRRDDSQRGTRGAGRHARGHNGGGHRDSNAGGAAAAGVMHRTRERQLRSEHTRRLAGRPGAWNALRERRNGEHAARGCDRVGHDRRDQARLSSSARAREAERRLVDVGRTRTRHLTLPEAERRLVDKLESNLAQGTPRFFFGAGPWRAPWAGLFSEVYAS